MQPAECYPHLSRIVTNKYLLHQYYIKPNLSKQIVKEPSNQKAIILPLTQTQNNQTQSRDSIKAEQENINDVNAERILKSIENKEQETLMRIHQRNKKTQRTDKNASSRYIEKPW